jgi:hypothetical protein
MKVITHLSITTQAGIVLLRGIGSSIPDFTKYPSNDMLTLLRE